MAIQKTTLYFLLDLIEMRDEWRVANDPEHGSEIVWQTSEFLIPHMRAQAKKFNKPDIDESEVLNRLEKVKKSSRGKTSV